ncbi:SDR family NAD(P)-dependent oxidoreductase [Candidatus Sodalis endolongispinus]|uniref:SDR family NAD(P)-dependent oxidoreductase n=1 Tax=Candidatus Sodalis endolongispinus TaxID=2812662 RepID=UPI0024849BB3|nr:SDR family oxidoreductase [Candidatus Sodalis endolongispinus]
MNRGEFSGRVALITGGSKGIGRAISLAQDGADIALLLRGDRTAGERAVQGLRDRGIRAQAWYADIAERVQVASAIEDIGSRLGRIDMLVNNAGANGTGALLSVADDEWHRVVRVNLTGSFVVATEAAKVMRAAGGGGIVNIAGASAHRCYPGAGAYGPAKAAIINLTRQMAVEWAPYGIRVNGVSPVPVRDDTPWSSMSRRWRRKWPVCRLGARGCRRRSPAR